ncbi:sulfurtransferase [Halobacillus seohaensis]|uniref:Sulfurtransferase n=1 Tax=Halobacillus seohaensis TaxID=447421 RepID=A0ABW2EMH2_9BACI
MYIVGIVVIIALLLSFFYRYIPVLGVQNMDIPQRNESEDDVVYIDTRDYQTSSRESANQAYCVPLPYLKRHYTDIPNKKLVLISSDQVERNLCVRILRRKGYEVVGYAIANQMSCAQELRCVCDE